MSKFLPHYLFALAVAISATVRALTDSAGWAMGLGVLVPTLTLAFIYFRARKRPQLPNTSS